MIRISKLWIEKMVCHFCLDIRAGKLISHNISYFGKKKEKCHKAVFIVKG